MSRTSPEAVLRIASLGHLGDGVAEDGRFVAFALPGEAVRVCGSGPRPGLEAVLEPSPDRVAPPCPHFGTCGGCALQHLAPAPLADFKRGIVAAALSHRGLDPAVVGETRTVPPLSRRRLVLTARHTRGRVLLGFQARGSHEAIDISECPVARPELVAGLPGLRAGLGPVLGGRAAVIHALWTQAGLDLDIRAKPALALDRTRESALVRLAETLDSARLSWSGEVVIQRRAPAVSFDGIAAVPPPAGFLQPTEEGEAILRALVLAALPERVKRVADLFAGAGTFALPLARRATVHAVEQDAAALTALSEAARRAPGLKPVTTERRDLFRRPLTVPELERFEAVVFDPPRAGAEALAANLAQSRVPHVIAISCSPPSFARDAAILVAGGYTLEAVTPVDQFLYSAHVEIAGVFRRR